MKLQVQFELFVKDSFSEVGTSKASMNRTGKTNAAKGVHNNYNEYKDFSDRGLKHTSVQHLWKCQGWSQWMVTMSFFYSLVNSLSNLSLAS